MKSSMCLLYVYANRFPAFDTMVLRKKDRIIKAGKQRIASENLSMEYAKGRRMSGFPAEQK